MNNHTEPQHSASFGMDDALYLFFRHKWKIIFFTLLGFAGAAAFFFYQTMEYRSQAKILVRYITEKKNPFEFGPDDKQSDTRALDPRDNATMAAEAAILQSHDSIVSAVKAIGSAKVLAPYGGGENANAAAQMIRHKKLEVELANRSGVMTLTLSHRDADIAQKLLGAIITEYMKMHSAIHSAGATLEQLTAQAEDFKTRLARTDDTLRAEKRRIDVSNLELNKSQLLNQMSLLQSSIYATDAELAEQRAALQQRGIAIVEEKTQSQTSKPAAPAPEDLQRYIYFSRRLHALREQEIELSTTFAETSQKVVSVRQQITNLEEQIKALKIDPVFLAQSAAPSASGGFDAQGARAKLAATEAKYSILTNRLADLKREAARIEAAEGVILLLERQKKELEERYAYYGQKVEEVRIEDTIGATRRNNISVVQNATSIDPDYKKLGKSLIGIICGGLALGLGLAFLSDYVINTTVKRSKELESNLSIPVFATVPNFRGKLKDKKARKNKKANALQKNGDHHAFTNGDIAPWDENDPMLPYYEALRDRIVMTYAGDVHKPKIVGLTSCNPGAGVTRLATGLAASLSRDAERNVLMVGLQRNKVAVSAFEKGRPTNGVEAPETVTTNEKELVAQNLYSLATTGRNLAGASVVQSFSELLPKLQICDYDYIIFDLPPLTQTSGSLRLASQMERTILVVEAEETAKDKVKRARNLLRESHLYAVLNKTRKYGPKSLQPEI